MKRAFCRKARLQTKPIHPRQKHTLPLYGPYYYCYLNVDLSPPPPLGRTFCNNNTERDEDHKVTAIFCVYKRLPRKKRKKMHMDG